MYGWVCVAWPCNKRPSPVARAPLLLCGQAAASWCTHEGLTKPFETLALAELLFSLESLWDLCCLVTGFSNL